MAKASREVLERKLGFLRQFLFDLETYSRLDQDGRRKEHYAIERLLQLLCESAADIGIQMLKRSGTGMAGSYREVFSSLSLQGSLPRPMADSLIDACGMRNVLTHLYDTIDLERVVVAVEPALELYRAYLNWALDQTADWG